MTLSRIVECTICGREELTQHEILPPYWATVDVEGEQTFCPKCAYTYNTKHYKRDRNDWGNIEVLAYGTEPKHEQKLKELAYQWM